MDQFYMTVQPEFINILNFLDYSQNLYIPKFPDKQRGETYYYSSMNLYQFNIVDVSKIECVIS